MFETNCKDVIEYFCHDRKFLAFLLSPWWDKTISCCLLMLLFCHVTGAGFVWEGK
jgi:hypothetical protein